MAHYEMYICLKKETYEEKVPSVLFSKLGWKIDDENKPTDSNTKTQIKTWLDSKSISYNSNDLKSDLLLLVEESGPTEDYIPSWKEAAFKGKLGAPRKSLDNNYIIIKGEFSILQGELSAIKALGNDMAYPNNSVLTKSEAQVLANSNIFTGE